MSNIFAPFAIQTKGRRRSLHQRALGGVRYAQEFAGRPEGLHRENVEYPLIAHKVDS